MSALPPIADVNIWQHEHPVAMAKALHAVIHKNATATEANDIFNETKNG